MGTRRVVPELAGYFEITPPQARCSRLAKGLERAVTGVCSQMLPFDTSTSIRSEIAQNLPRLSF